MQRNFKNITFVIPWYGADIGGGAETLCMEFAERLSKLKYPLRVLTTCCKSFQENWNNNSLQPGENEVNGVKVFRFKVRQGNHKIYNELNHRILLNYPISSEEEKQFFSESINSDSLLQFIKDNCSEDILIFIPYLYGLIYFGIQIYPKQSFFLPCLHKEGYANLKLLNPIFNSNAGIIFNSDEEMRFAKKIFGLEKTPTTVVGMGIEKKFKGNPERFRDKYNIHEPFILYVGRKDETKNVPFLVKMFSKYKEDENRNLKLVLVGSGEVSIENKIAEHVIDLGFIDEESKADGYAAAFVLSQPSVNESFSITIMESWLEGVPVIVNSLCDVTRSHCEKSNGGLFFKDYFEFREILNFLIDNPAARKTLGEQGRQYVLKNYTWENILSKFLCFVRINEK